MNPAEFRALSGPIGSKWVVVWLRRPYCHCNEAADMQFVWHCVLLNEAGRDPGWTCREQVGNGISGGDCWAARRLNLASQGAQGTSPVDGTVAEALSIRLATTSAEIRTDTAES